MIADRTTDAIAHFIGLFEQKIEEMRDRDVYNAFKALQADVELEPLEIVDPETDEKFTLRQADDRPLAGLPPAEAPEDLLVTGPGLALTATGLSGPAGAFLPPVPVIQHADGGPHFHYVDGIPDDDVPLVPTGPGSITSVTFQTLHLSDNDRLGKGDFRDASGHARDLDHLAQAMQAMHVPIDIRPGEVPHAETLLALKSALDGFTATGAEGVDVYLLRGEALPGLSLLNGVEQDVLPRWKDILPEHHRPEDEAELQAKLDLARDLPREYVPNPETPEGHTLVTGGNLLANEAYLSVSLVDAPLIAVGGSWESHDIISQVAALRDHDSGPGAGPAQGSVFQSIRIDATANPASWQEGRDFTAAGPKTILLDYVDRDLHITTYLEQEIHLLDNDNFGMAITGANTEYLLGDNTMINVATLFTAGFAYDLILVSGNFIQVDAIQQTLILLDDDVIHPGTLTDKALAPAVQDTGVAEAGSAQASKDVLIEDAATGPTGSDNPVPPGSPAGNEAPAQVDVAGVRDGKVSPSRDVAPAEDAVTSRGPAPAKDAAAPAPAQADIAATGIADDAPEYGAAPDNLLLNEARLTTMGVDIRADLSESLAEMVRDPDLDLQALQHRLLNDPALAGLEQARVLKIDGDLIQSNVIKQTITAADNDDIRIDGGMPGGMELVAGSNALLNAATIATRGVDSTVMADSGYSDLLVHQAGFIDEPDVPDRPDVPTTGLANEAVAFLMEDTTQDVRAKMADKMDGMHTPLVHDANDLMANTLA